MKYRKEIVTTAGTLACAIGIGFFMQQGTSVPNPEYQGATLINADAAVLDVEEIILTSAEFADGITAPKLEEAVTPIAAQAITAPAESELPVMQTASATDMLGMPEMDAPQALARPDV